MQDRPTLIGHAETLAAVLPVAVEGGSGYRQSSPRALLGSNLLTICNACRRPDGYDIRDTRRPRNSGYPIVGHLRRR